MNVPDVSNNWYDSLQFKRSKAKVTERQKPEENDTSRVITAQFG